MPRSRVAAARAPNTGRPAFAAAGRPAGGAPGATPRGSAGRRPSLERAEAGREPRRIAIGVATEPEAERATFDGAAEQCEDGGRGSTAGEQPGRLPYQSGERSRRRNGREHGRLAGGDAWEDHAGQPGRTPPAREAQLRGSHLAPLACGLAAFPIAVQVKRAEPAFHFHTVFTSREHHLIVGHIAPTSRSERRAGSGLARPRVPREEPGMAIRCKDRGGVNQRALEPREE